MKVKVYTDTPLHRLNYKKSRCSTKVNFSYKTLSRHKKKYNNYDNCFYHCHKKNDV